jgi:catechol 2,3-dioxygenase
MQQFGESNDEEGITRKFGINSAARIGYVTLNVSDLQRSLEFYQSILGFRKLREPSTNRLLLSSNEMSSSSSSPYLLELVQVDQAELNSVTSKRAGIPFCNIASRKEKFGRCASSPKRQTRQSSF